MDVVQKVIDALGKKISKNPTPELVSEFRQLIPATLDAKKVDTLISEMAAIKRRVDFMEQSINNIDQYLVAIKRETGYAIPESL